MGQHYACAIIISLAPVGWPIVDSVTTGLLVRATTAGVKLALEGILSGYIMSNPLWEYSLVTYRAEEIAATCLALQDRFGVDVNLLLYAAWLARNNRCLDTEHLNELDALVTKWRDSVVRPLRGLRRQLQTYTEAAAVREELKTLELRAEQEQQEVMYAFHQRSVTDTSADDSLLGNLTRVALLASPGSREWESTISQLATLIARCGRGGAREGWVVR